MTLFINGEKASIPEKHYAQFHGHSVFTTLRSKDGVLLNWQLHWQRLLEHAHFFGFKAPIETSVLSVINAELGQNDKKIRVIISAGDYAITCEDYQKPDPNIYQGVKVITSTFTVHKELAQFKTGNSLPYFLAHRQAVAQNAFEALLLDHEGFVADGSRTSLLMVKDQTIFSLAGGLLGTMRQAVLMWAKTQGFSCVEVRLKPHEINGTLLLANSLLGIVPKNRVGCELSFKLVEQFRMD